MRRRLRACVDRVNPPCDLPPVPSGHHASAKVACTQGYPSAAAARGAGCAGGGGERASCPAPGAARCAYQRHRPVIGNKALLSQCPHPSSPVITLTRLIHSTVAKRAYRCSAPAVCNSLPKTVVNSDSVTVFKSRLKTFLFSRAFSLPASP